VAISPELIEYRDDVFEFRLEKDDTLNSESVSQEFYLKHGVRRCHYQEAFRFFSSIDQPQADIVCDSLRAYFNNEYNIKCLGECIVSNSDALIISRELETLATLDRQVRLIDTLPESDFRRGITKVDDLAMEFLRDLDAKEIFSYDYCKKDHFNLQTLLVHATCYSDERDYIAYQILLNGIEAGVYDLNVMFIMFVRQMGFMDDDPLQKYMTGQSKELTALPDTTKAKWSNYSAIRDYFIPIQN